jgi:competence protein ComGC
VKRIHILTMQVIALNNLRNQRGAALVLTVMIITLILLFILMLLTTVTNTTRQVTTVEGRLVASHLAEMGVDYYQELVESSIKNIITDPEEITLPELKEGYGQLDNTGHYRYEIVNPTLSQESDSVLNITFSSKGITPETEFLIEDIVIPITIKSE